MMLAPDKKKREMIKILLEWWYFDDKGIFHLKDFAPKEIVELNEEYIRLYVH